jgi:hypothetical protein
MRLVSLFSALALVACTDAVVTDTPHQGSPALPPATTTTTYPIAIGATTGVAPGTMVGYSVTAIAPNTYRVFWTGDARVNDTGFREFYGSIWTPGRFVGVTPGCASYACPLEDGDWVSSVTEIPGGERIDWDTYASVGLDGFDVTTDGAPVVLDVYVDGVRRADLAFFPSAEQGARVVSPSVAPFGVQGR